MDLHCGVVMIGDEARVVSAFRTFVDENGSEVQQELDFVDVAATRAGITLLAEAKGRTSSPGLDVDTLYGQLPRRIPGSSAGSAMLAVVVPDVAVKVGRPACLRRGAQRVGRVGHPRVCRRRGRHGRTLGEHPDPITAAP